MKKRLVTLLLCIGLFSAMAEIVQAPMTVANQAAAEEKIDLKGDIDLIRPRRGTAPITAFISGDELTAYFYSNLGHVTIAITDQYDNTVYSSVVDSSSGSTTISLSTLPLGTYTITFSNSNGAMWGDFVL